MNLTTMKSYLFLRRLWILWILLAMPLAAETVRIYVTNRGGTTIDVIDPKTNKVVHVIKGFVSPEVARFSPDGNRIYIPSRSDEKSACKSAQELKPSTLFQTELIRAPNMRIR